VQSRVQRYLELSMELPDGQKIQQNKETLSNITSFLGQSQQPVMTSDPQLQQTTFQNSNGAENHRRVVPAGGVRRQPLRRESE
jgi:hypothetical protein